jgi:hypothetical protein
MPEPAVSAYRTESVFSFSFKSRTVIAESVTDWEEHQRLVESPEGYRPATCGCCGRRWPHGHGCRWRLLRGEPGWPGVEIRRYRCPACRSIWQVLPGLLARFLQSSWAVIQAAMACLGALSSSKRRLRRRPQRHRQWERWRQRLKQSAGPVRSVLAEAQALPEAALAASATAASRAQLVECLASHGLVSAEDSLAETAAWTHRLMPGLRLV